MFFNVLTNVARFGQGRGIGDGERNIQDTREGLSQQRLSGARRPDQQDIGFGELHIAADASENIALVVIVDRDGKLFLRRLLTHHVLIEECLDLRRARQLRLRGRNALSALFLENPIAHADALSIADIRTSVIAGRGDKLRHGVLRLLTKRATEHFLATRTFQIRLRGLLVLVNDFIEDAIFVRLLGIHPEITFHVAFNLFNRLVGMLGHDFVHAGADA